MMRRSRPGAMAGCMGLARLGPVFLGVLGRRLKPRAENPMGLGRSVGPGRGTACGLCVLVALRGARRLFALGFFDWRFVRWA